MQVMHARYRHLYWADIDKIMKQYSSSRYDKISDSDRSVNAICNDKMTYKFQAYSGQYVENFAVTNLLEVIRILNRASSCS